MERMRWFSHPRRFSSGTENLVKSLPGKAYTDPKFYDIERKHALGPSWQLITHESLLLKDADKGPATYVSDVVSGFPAIVVRSSSTGEINAYHNVCRHKAGPLEWSDSQGVCPLNGLKCKYHGWTYSLDGKLKGVPGFGDAKFDKSQYSLWPMRVAVWQGMVFVQALPPEDSTSCSFSGQEAHDKFVLDNKAFCDRLNLAANDAGGTSLQDYHFYKGATHKLNCNWKVYVENYLEGYHIPTIHPGLNREVDMKTYHVTCDDGIVEHITDTTQESAYNGVWVWHYPTLAINWYGPGLSLERIVPTGPHTTEIRYQYLFSEAQQQLGASEKHAIDTSAEVTVEDIHVCEAVQERLSGGGYLEPGFLSPRHENGVAYFQDKIRKVHNTHCDPQDAY